mgnify:CR=1 FL=1
MHKHGNFENLWVADHPVIDHKISQIRNVATDKRIFRDNVKQIAQMMSYAVTSELEVSQQSVETPITTYMAPVLKNSFPVIVPILRAGLAMADGLEEVLTESTVAHIGMYRDHDTLEAIEYLNKLPDLKDRDVILVDPMLATGNSAELAADMIMAKGADPKRVIFLVLLAAPEGVIMSATLDERLNENAYIVPGLGDAGDRCFGTE